jgi:hypothetical protein
MKKLDKLLIKSFIGPFIVTFMIATFVLLMQFLWLYVDDLAGKGLGMLIVFELLGYKCVGVDTYGNAFGHFDFVRYGFRKYGRALRIVEF